MTGTTNAKRIKWVGIGLALAVTFGLGYYASRARAAGIPQVASMVYSGTLTDGKGAPLTGLKNIQLQIYGAATGGGALCQSLPATVTLVAGTFRVPLGDDCIAVVHANPDLFIDVLVDGASVGRAKLGAVPYAVEAEIAQHSATATPGGGLDLQLVALTTRDLRSKTQSHTIGEHMLFAACSAGVAMRDRHLARGVSHRGGLDGHHGQSDGTAYSELMVAQSASPTTELRIWKGLFYTPSSTMHIREGRAFYCLYRGLSNDRDGTVTTAARACHLTLRVQGKGESVNSQLPNGRRRRSSRRNERRRRRDLAVAQ